MKPITEPKNIPQVLKDKDSWLLWKLVPARNAAGEDKPLKVPYYADGTKRRGVVGSEADKAKLVSFREALQALKAGGGKFSGIGFAPMAEHDDITILDIDSCIDAEGNLSEFAQQVVDSGTYVERSPSGRGLRAVYIGGALCPGEKKNGFLDNGERVEIYCGRAYVTMTGDRVEGAGKQATKIPPKIKRELKPVVESGGSGVGVEGAKVEGDVLLSPDAGPLPNFTIEQARKILDRLPEHWGESGNGTWYKVAGALHLQFDGSEEAYELLDEWSRTKDGYDEEANRKHWNRNWAHEQGREGLTTMRNIVYEAIENGARVKKKTMQAWGLARKAEDDFLDEDEAEEATLPEYSDLRALSDITTMVQTPAPPVEWLVQDLIPRGTVSFLAGGSGTSKSYLTLQMCAVAACGEDIKEFADMKITDGGFRSLYLAYEDGRASLHVRVEEVKNWVYSQVKAADNEVLGQSEADEEADDVGEVDESVMRRVQNALREQLGILPAEVLDSGAFMLAKAEKRFEPLKLTKLLPYLQDYVRTNYIDLVVIDTGSEIHTGDENSASDMVVLMKALRLLASSTNCGVLVVQHVSKGVWNLSFDEINQASIRGSSVLVDKSRNVFMLARMPRKDAPRFGLPDTNDTHDDYVVLKHVKANLGAYVKPKVFYRTAKGRLKYEPQYVLDDTRPPPVDGLSDAERQRLRERHAKNMAARGKIMEFLVKECEGVERDADLPSTTRIQVVMDNKGIGQNACGFHLKWLLAEGYVECVADGRGHRAAKRYRPIKEWDGGPEFDETAEEGGEDE